MQTMPRKENFVEMPATEVTENSAQIEETSLQMEELESIVAPSAAWGS
jgi:hypothetical protein